MPLTDDDVTFFSETVFSRSPEDAAARQNYIDIVKAAAPHYVVRAIIV
jgi:hypothetical protein